MTVSEETKNLYPTSNLYLAELKDGKTRTLKITRWGTDLNWQSFFASAAEKKRFNLPSPSKNATKHHSTPFSATERLSATKRLPTKVFVISKTKSLELQG